MSLKELQKLWYKKAKESGFNDIEVNGYLYHWDSSKNFTEADSSNFSAKYHYYLMATEFLNMDPFDNEEDRIVWTLHSEGLSIREIKREIEQQKLPIKRKSIGSIFSRIARIKKLMLYRFNNG